MKLWIRRVLNLLLWLNVCFLAGSGLALFTRMPHGPQGRGLSLWGLSKHDWGEVHAWAGIVFAVLVVAHLVMAWPWLKNAAAKRHLWPVVGGLVAGIALAAALIFGPITQGEGGVGEGPGTGQGTGWQNGGQGGGGQGGGGWQGGK